MDLATLQRKLFGMIRDDVRPDENDHAYLHQVEQTGATRRLRKISNWWIERNVENFCIMTAKVLKKLELFEAALEETVLHGASIAYIPDLGSDFLRQMERHPHPLVVSVADFEFALIKVKTGASETFTTDWTYNPYDVLESLFDDQRELPEPGGHFQTAVAKNIPRFFKVYELENGRDSEA